MTGPHMFDGVSHPPKAAPVDTAALKLRIQAGEQQKARYAAAPGSATPMMQQVMGERLAAKQDTLAKARVGKIPAKKGG